MANIVNPNLSFNGSLTPINKNGITHYVHHHMAHESWDVHDVHDFHMNGNGWFGLGYNFWIAFDGTIYEGRGWNVGAHVSGYNSRTIGIGYQGNFETQQMTDKQVEAGKDLIAYLDKELGRNIQSVGHGDLASTACPGKNFRMDEVRGGELQPKKAPSGSYTGSSIVDYLNSKKRDSSFENRKKLAAAHGISNYTGTEEQNLKLLDMMRTGKTPNNN